MGDANKILTVSYGTFSCTLEGFDDPFTTMKAIAEYFRDLAAEDRFFGAEPPTPDVQMLHAIAQKNAETPVAAAVDDNGLRLTQAAETPAPEAPVEEPVAETPVEETPVEAPDVAEAVTAEPEPAEDDTVDAVEADASEPEAPADEPEVDLDAVAEAVAEEPAEQAEEPETAIAEDDMPAVAGDEAVEVVADEPVDEVAEIEEDAPEHMDAVESSDAKSHDPLIAALLGDDDDADNIFAEAEDAEPVDAELEQQPADEVAQDDAAESSIAAKLARIRAVVSANANGSDEAAYEEDNFDADDADVEDDFEVAAAEDVEAFEPAEDFDEVAFDEDAEFEVEEVEAEAAPAEEFEPAAEAEEFDPEPAMDTDEDDFVDAFEDDYDAPAPSEPIATPAQRGPQPLDLSVEDLSESETALRGRDAPRPAAFARTLESENAAYAESSLSDEDEADLMAELAEIEAEVDGFDQEEEFDVSAAFDMDEPEAPAAEPVAEEEPAAREGRSILEGDDIEREDAALDRLLAQTNSKLRDGGTQRRQSALSHLKAAVVATLADRSSDDDEPAKEEADNTDSFRKDLAKLVRPSRVTRKAADPASEDVAEDKPATPPLVLVQQVEEEAQADPAPAAADDTPRGPVRPRRIARGEAAGTAAGGMDDKLDTGFADYADRVGASELSELLEAAAVYLNKVEGQPHFSRPQVMHMVMRHNSQQDFSREDSLRSFGDLLRKGTIEKVDRGQFVISEDSRFLEAG